MKKTSEKLFKKNLLRFSFQNMVAKMFSNSSKMSRKSFDVFQKIEKCRAVCRGRTCTVGKTQMVFRRIRGWPGNPRSQPRPLPVSVGLSGRFSVGSVAGPGSRKTRRGAATDPDGNAPFGSPSRSLGSGENSVGVVFRFARSGASPRPVARKVVQKHPFSTPCRCPFGPGCTSRRELGAASPNY